MYESSSLGTAHEERDFRGVEDDEGIQSRREVLDVVEVVFQLDNGALDGAPGFVIDLRPARNSRLDAMALAVVGNLLLEFSDEFRPLRARADDRHIAPQDVEQLRQLIHVELAQPSSDGRNAGIVLLGPDRAAVSLVLGPHGAEFIYRKRHASFSDALRPTQDL